MKISTRTQHNVLYVHKCKNCKLKKRINIKQNKNFNFIYLGCIRENKFYSNMYKTIWKPKKLQKLNLVLAS